jgi:hypothetical protein
MMYLSLLSALRCVARLPPPVERGWWEEKGWCEHEVRGWIVGGEGARGGGQRGGGRERGRRRRDGASMRWKVRWML